MVVKKTQDSHREIIPDLAKAIKDGIKKHIKPEKTVIDFRNELKEGIERDVVAVKSGLLRFRKENGRIAAEVASYEKAHAPLNDDDEVSQKIIRDFLRKSDPEKTENLMKLLEHKGQREPAIITVDGFLVNGNRRKMAMDELYEKTKNNEFEWIKVVILPGKNEDGTGGPPTIKEIAQIEHRCQTQSDGKSEYSNLSKALTYRNNRDKYGLTILEQLKDDPVNAGLTEKQYQGAETRLVNNYIGPLECVDAYLDYLGRTSHYDDISPAKDGEGKGRWQAFVDYYKLREVIFDEKKREQFNIKEKDVGKLESVCFDIIRKQDFKGLPKLHEIIRNIKKTITATHNKMGIEQLLKVVDDKKELLPEELKNKDGNELNLKEIDKKWGAKNNDTLTQHLHLSIKYTNKEEMRGAVLKFLNEASNNITNPEIERDITLMRHNDISEGIQIANKIIKNTKIILKNLMELSKQKDKDIKKLEKKY